MKLGIIGFGNMGSAIAKRAKADYQVIIFDKDKNKTGDISDLEIAKDLPDLASQAEIIILAVKPQDFGPLLAQLKNILKKKLVISIAAGVTTAFIEKNLPGVRVIRAMPNMPAQIGEGISCICKGKFADEADLDLVRQLLRCVGEVLPVDEDMMNAVTAVSGSGPAYYCFEKQKDGFTDKLADAAIGIGFDKATAILLSKKTVTGTVALLNELHISCEELIKRVASKGGTTEAALNILHNGGSLDEAVKAALKRARELAGDN